MEVGKQRSRAIRAEAMKEIKKSHLIDAINYNHQTTTLKSVRIPNQIMNKATQYMNQHNVSFSQLVFKALENEMRKR